MTASPSPGQPACEAVANLKGKLIACQRNGKHDIHCNTDAELLWSNSNPFRGERDV